MKIAIIDDKIMNVRLLQHMITEIASEANIIGTANSVASGIALLKERKPDLIFLDIDMGDGYGFDVLTQTQEMGYAVVFVTAFPNYALRSFAYDPLHYLVKPVQEEELREALFRFERRKVGNAAPDPPAPTPSPGSQGPIRICIPEKDRLRFVFVSDIIYLESSRAYVVIHLTSGKAIVSTKSMSSYEELLAPHQFCRIHDKYLLNIQFVQTYIKGRGGEVALTTGSQLPVAVRRRDAFLEMMGYN